MLSLTRLKSIYSNEQVLTILLTRVYFATENIKNVHSFLSEETIDWNSFYKVISINGIRGFIYDVITESQIPIDPKIHNTLKKDAMGISLVGSCQADLIGNLTTEFEKLGITVIPYKGHTLATRYYKSPLFREGSDLDFLVSKDDVLQLRDCLYENGYEAKYNISEHQMGFVLCFHRELSFASPKNRMGISCSVELKWKLLNNYFRKFYHYDFFVQHLQTYTATDGTSRLGLTPTYDFLCVASHHLIREPLLKFKYLIDLACIVQTSSDQLDWKAIDLHFRRNNFSPFFWSGINALQEIIGFERPVQDVPAVPYHLFTATENRTGRQFYYKKNRLVSWKLPLLEKLKHTLKVRLSLLIPNLNDLSKTEAPAWTIPFIMPVKSIRFLYLYIIKKR